MWFVGTCEWDYCLPFDEDVKRCELHDKESDPAYSLIVRVTIHLFIISTVWCQLYHSVHQQLGSNTLEHKLHERLTWSVERDGRYKYWLAACILFLVGLPIDKYEALISSLDGQGKDNLTVDRLNYQLLQSSDSKAFSHSTRKDSKANFSKSNVSDNHWFPVKWINESFLWFSTLF